MAAASPSMRPRAGSEEIGGRNWLSELESREGYWETRRAVFRDGSPVRLELQLERKLELARVVVRVGVADGAEGRVA